MSDRTVDLLVLGGGLSGTLALLALADTGWADAHRITVVDRAAEPLAGREWGYWSTAPVVPHTDAGAWSRLRLLDGERSVAVGLKHMRYRRLSGTRLARRLREAVAGAPGMNRLEGEVVAVRQAGRDHADVRLTDGSQLRARFVLDSTRGLAAVPEAPVLTFLGCRLPSGTLLPGAPWTVTLMDLRVPQHEGVRFVYVVPADSGGGLVELTAFLPSGGPEPGLAPDLQDWIEAELGAAAAGAATRHEQGRYPLVRTGRRRLSPSVMLIGLGAGCIRPATGYGVMLMARDARAMAQSLDRHGHPFVRHPLTRRERWLDRVFLNVMRSDPAVVRDSYLDMFAGAGGDTVLRFLNGEMRLHTALRVIRSLPMAPYGAAALRSRRGAM